MKYLMQIKSRPPTFYLYVNDRSIVDENFLRFLRHSLIKEFNLEGVPVRVLVRDVSLVSRTKGGSNSLLGQKVVERIKKYKAKMKSVTYRRRLSGNKFLYR